MSKSRPMPSLLPCPCCGESKRLREAVPTLGREQGYEGLYWGHHSADTMCIQCYTCGLRMIVTIPDEWPKDMPEASWEALEDWTLAEAVKRWNKRTIVMGKRVK